MAVFTLTDAVGLLGAYEIDALANSLSLEASADEIEVTTFGDTAHKRIAGLTDSSWSYEGFADYDTTGWDSAIFSNLGVADSITSFAANDSENEIAYTVRGVQLTYSAPSGSIGDAATFSLGGSSTEPLRRGRLIQEGETLTATGTSTGYDEGASQNGNTVYGALHVVSASGSSPTLDVTVQSDTAGFASPTTVLTFTQATGITSEWQTATVGNTDQWWRASYTNWWW